MQLADRTCWWLLLAAVASAAGCHREVVEPAPRGRVIAITDKFFDVHARDPENAIVVGYGGKILRTADGGFTWSQVRSGTTRALYRLCFVDANTGWISGQDGAILRTTDGGLTWQPQKSGTDVYLFSIHFVDNRHGWAVGDKSIFVETRDGGATWTPRKIVPASQKDLSPEEALVSQDPVLYDVQFLDTHTGWVVGEFGKIYHTTDGGQTWTEQERSLLGDQVVDILDIPTFFGIRMIDARHGLVAGLDGKVARTEDGTNWKFDRMQLDYPIVDPLFTPAFFADGSGWAIGAAGEVVRLDTAGGAWRRAKLGMEILTWLRGMSWLNQQDGWLVGGFGLILHTTDGGQTWIPSLG
ncbi:MAG: YCF48-related protein [Candidatus Binatia bacterium]